jgi:hypothetical protein
VLRRSAPQHAAGYAGDNPADWNHCGALSAQNIGFTDHFRHRCWHFIDVAFAQDGTTNLAPTPVPNAQERIGVFRPVLGGNDEDLKAYDLSWLLHLVGDLHQPLHCTTRVSQSQPDGDAGGNLITVTTGNSAQKLHLFWDDLLGPSSANAKTVAASAMNLAAAGATKASDLDVGHWVAEGIQNAKDSVYTGPVGAGAGPFTLTEDYKNAAKALAKKQVALAGARLANLLNSELK